MSEHTARDALALALQEIARHHELALEVTEQVGLAQITVLVERLVRDAARDDAIGPRIVERGVTAGDDRARELELGRRFVEQRRIASENRRIDRADEARAVDVDLDPIVRLGEPRIVVYVGQ